MTRDERNAAAIEGLHPRFRDLVTLLLVRIAGIGVKPLIVQARRTFEEQSKLYAQGRTTDGPKVTNARAGTSYHQYGLAIDLVDVAASGNPDAYDASDWNTTNYEAIAAHGRALGMEWGGAWRTFQDRPHFEWHPGFGPSDAMSLAQHCRPDETLPDDFFDAAIAEAKARETSA